MITLQVLNKVILDQDISIILDNQLTEDYFTGYTDEFNFIMEHYNTYGNVPDKLTFLNKFQNFELIEVDESNEYLVDALREDYLYHRSIPVLQHAANLLTQDANKASEYLITSLRDLQPSYRIGGIDIIKQAEERLEAFKDKRDNQKNWFFTTGFPELDDAIHGIQRQEELILLFARTNQGKSWVLEKMCTHIWEIGGNVGYISPEMGALSVGYRFDTLYRNFSNKDLSYGNKDFDESSYSDYIEELKKHDNKFIVATPSDFGNNLTVSKIKHFVLTHKLDVVAIDGVSYLADERFRRGDTEAQKLTHLGEDLWALTRDIHVPILIVAQANRSGAIDKESEETPEVESVRGGDGLSLNASKIISLKQNSDGVLIMQVKKQRGGVVGTKISYQWSPDVGEFIGSQSQPTKPKKKIKEKEDVF